MTENTSTTQSQTTTNTVTNSTVSKPIQSTQQNRKFPMQYIIAAIITVLVIIGGVLGFYLMNQNQDIRQQAAGWCTGPEQCNPGWEWGGGEDYCSPGLRYCNPPSSGGGGGGNTNPSPTTSGCTPNTRMACGTDGCTGGRQKICQSNRTWGACVNSDQCLTAVNPGACTGRVESACKVLAGDTVTCRWDKDRAVPTCIQSAGTGGTTPTVYDITTCSSDAAGRNSGCGGNGQAQCKCSATGAYCDTGHTFTNGACRAPSTGGGGTGGTTCASAARNCSVTCANNENLSTTCAPTFTDCNQWQTQACSGKGGIKGGTAVASPTSTNPCPNGNCSSTSTQCVVIHRCATLNAGGTCVQGSPEIRKGVSSANAQQLANASCGCVQVDVLSGANGTCDTGHIVNGDTSTLKGSSVACSNSTTCVAPAPSPTSSVCGGACNINSECPNNHQCSNNKCVLNACMVNNAKCSADKCNVSDPEPSPTTLTCGATCGAAGTQCPNGHTCNTGTCKLNACLVAGATCTTNKCAVVTTTTCGQACSANVLCPNGHTCNAGTCKLDACLVSGTNCTTNKCQLVAPICLNITASKTADIKVGDAINFTCGTVANATSYEFRVRAPGGTVTTLTGQATTPNVSQAFTITAAGAHNTQCRVCMGTACSEWEGWPN